MQKRKRVYQPCLSDSHIQMFLGYWQLPPSLHCALFLPPSIVPSSSLPPLCPFLPPPTVPSSFLLSLLLLLVAFTVSPNSMALSSLLTVCAGCIAGSWTAVLWTVVFIGMTASRKGLIGKGTFQIGSLQSSAVCRILRYLLTLSLSLRWVG